MKKIHARIDLRTHKPIVEYEYLLFHNLLSHSCVYNVCRYGTRVAATSEVGNWVDVLRIANIRNAKGLDTFG